MALGANVVSGPDFGDPTGFVGQQTADCALDSAVTGFTGNIGDLVDNVSLLCSPLNDDGSVGTGPVTLTTDRWIRRSTTRIAGQLR